jgi:hypothetical protein
MEFQDRYYLNKMDDGNNGCEKVLGLCLPSQIKLSDLYTGVGLILLVNLLRMIGGGFGLGNMIDISTSSRVFLIGTIASILGRLAAYFLHNITLFSFQKQ